MMSSNIEMPRKGSLQRVYNMFGYLSKYHNSRLLFDPIHPVIDEGGLRFSMGDIFMVTCLRGCHITH